MSDETRITGSPSPKDIRITADIPSKADTHICLNPVPEEEGSKPSLSQQPEGEFRLPWLPWFLVALIAVVIWLLAHFIGIHAEMRQRQADRREMQEKIDRFIKEVQRGK